MDKKILFLETEVSKIVSSLEGTILDETYLFLKKLHDVREYKLCWETLADLISEKEEKGFLKLKDEKKKIIHIAKELNLDETYILIFTQVL